MAESSVAVDTTSVLRAWRDAAYGDFWIELRTAAPDEAAVIEALDALAEDERAGGIIAEFPTHSPRGIVTQVSGAPDGEPGRVESWLGLLSERLAEAGMEGTVAGVRSVHWPQWIDFSHPPEPSAFMAWQLDLETASVDTRHGGDWLVAPEATQRICDHLASWVAAGGPDTIVRRNLFNFRLADTSSLGPILASAISDTGMAGALGYSADEKHGRLVYLEPQGASTAQIAGGPTSWADRLDALRTMITGHPDLVDLAFVRPASRAGCTWTTLDYLVKLPGISEMHVRYNRHLLGTHVPDAHGIQVLTDAHLERARDLRAWTVTDLGHGRHLVEAADLAPWYSQPLPDPAVVESARRDFGEMILTHETVVANPPPWGATPVPPVDT